jgi:RHS repeat-associated protein
VYDTLSRLQSETRQFTALIGAAYAPANAAYTISYDYNLSGELKSVTNPWGVAVGYTHDVQGRVSAVTGAGYAGVSSYINGLGYRASGAAKQISYANGKQLSVSYDTRLRPTTWNVAGVLGSNYVYDDFNEKSGRVTFAQSLVDATLDREYDYDHVGRLAEAHTGAEARAARQGQGAPADGPYSQSYRYDEWGNMWARVGWGGEHASDNATFTNNRRDGLGYDAAGNLTNDGGQSFTYDVAGKQTYASGSALSQSYDGDGLRVKKVEQGYATYYLRSSVLGGQVIAEINSWGGWARGYVYLGGQLLAIQDGAVIFVHQDPITKSQRLTDTYGNIVSGVELDPWGGDTSRSWNQTRQPHKFTSYERDGNGADDAQARRYHGYWNRFSQPDPTDSSYNLADPQSFNRYAYVQNDPVNLVDPSGLQGEALGQGLAQAGSALQRPSCRGLFRGTNPTDLLNTYRANGLIEVNDRPRVPGSHTERGRFRDSGVGAATSVATASLTLPNGTVQSAPTITINRNGFFFNFRDGNGGDVRTAPELRGLSDPQIRGAVIVHELAHGAGVILADGDSQARSRLNSTLVHVLCFSPDRPVVNPPTQPGTQLNPIGGGGGGGGRDPMPYRGGGFGGWTSLDFLSLMYGGGGGGGHVTVTIEEVTVRVIVL